MASFLKKIFEATRLTGGGRLVEATATLQRALAETISKAPPTARKRRPAAASAASAVKPAAAAVLDGLVREAPAGRAAPSADEPRVVPPARAPRFSASSFTNAGGTRAFKLFEPSGFGDKPLPLVVMLHGCTQNPDDFAAGTRMNELAQEHGLFVLYPEQAARSNANRCWNWFVPGDQKRGGGEPALIAGMTRHVIRGHGIDPDRVYVAGLSAGGAMAAILAREYPELYAAAGVHSGLPPGAAHDVASAFSAMKSGPGGAGAGWPMAGSAGLWPGLAPAAAEPVARAAAKPGAPLIVFHGAADSTVAPVNGDAVIAAALAGRSGAVAVEDSGSAGPGRGWRRTVWRASAGSTAPSLAEQWVVAGAPHAWSGGAAAGSFTDPAGPDASAAMLDFFLEHPRTPVA